MPTYGLSDSGFVAPRGSDFLALIRSQFETELAAAGFTASIDWEADTFLGLVTTAMADQLGALSEINQAVYDGWDVNNATGLQLDNLAIIVGVTRTPASNSTASVTLTGTSGTVIPSGAIVQGGGPSGTSRWTLDDTVTLSGGTGSGTVTAQDLGAIDADAAAITTIVTHITGWTAVTNASPATPGLERETDASLRLRRQQSLQTSGSRSLNALRANLLAVDGVQSVVVVQNDTPSTTTVSGISLAGSSIGVVVYPDTLTTAQKSALVQTIYDHIPAGIGTNGAQTATVTALDGFAVTIRWAWATTTTVNVATTVTLASGYDLADVSDAIEALIADYFLTLKVGQTAYNSDVIVLARTVEGVVNATATLNGGASVVPAGTALLVLGTNVVS